MVEVPVSIGELLDKMTILSIKIDNMKSQDKINNCKKELDFLEKVVSKHKIIKGDDYDELIHVNKELWNIEDMMRKMEAEGNFGTEFIELTRGEYRANDLRAEIKRRINVREESGLFEEKEYVAY